MRKTFPKAILQDFHFWPWLNLYINNIYNINFILGSDAEGNHTVCGGVSGISLIHSWDIWLKQLIPTNITGKKKEVERNQSDLNTNVP